MSADENQPPVIVERDRKAEIGAFVVGALVGAGLALLFAPNSGAETQKRLRARARQVKELAEEGVRGLRDELGTRMDSARAAADQGRKLAADARQDVERKLARTKSAYRAGLAAAREEAQSDERSDR